MGKIGTLLFTLLCYFGWINSIHCAGLGPRSEYIAHYEGLEYDTYSLHQNHERVRRSASRTSTDRESEVRFSFNAMNRQFKLRLRRDISTFVSKPESIQEDGSVIPLDTSHIYEGVLEDEPHSRVHGSIIDGIFAGRIDIDSSTSYYIDKPEVHFPSSADGEHYPYHSIIYAERDVIKEPNIRARQESKIEGDSSGCPMSRSDIKKWMEQVQRSAVNSPKNENKYHEPREWDDSGHQFYDSNVWAHTGQSGESRRTRRDTPGNPGNPNNRVCSLFLQSDPMMWNYMTNGTNPNNGVKYGLGYSPARARDEITALFASHVNGMKQIYQRTVFQWGSLGPFYNFTFVVHRIQINTSYGCISSDLQGFCQPNMDISNFLNLNSQANQNLYCTAFIFTYRDFSGTLGLAWVGSATGSAGGICEKYKQYSDGIGGTVFKSLNTGVLSILNYGTRVPTVVSTLTFAHEIGHNFGSPHDTDPACAPTLNNRNDPNGNYIMFASATPGTFPNNHNFSICSIGNMTQVINAVLTGAFGKVNCFTESSEAFCGNRIQEGTEQCDCGFESDCQSPDNPDVCCHPEESEFRCTLTPNASCSASEGPCCNGSVCKYMSASSNVICFTETECSYSSTCSGSAAKCPTPGFKQNLTMCNSNTQVCKGGSCQGSVCETIGWAVCSLDTSTLGTSSDLGLLCFVACLNPVTQKCVSTNSKSDLAIPENNQLLNLLRNISHQQTGIHLLAGMPCNNYQGYCDVFQKCRAANEEGPLARLQDIFNPLTANEIRTWITSKWWAVLLMAIGVVILMGLFIKVCAVHTPSSNPKQKAARKLTLPRHHAPRTERPPPSYSEADTRRVPVVNSVIDGNPPHMEGAKQTGERPASRSHRHGNKTKSTAASSRVNPNIELDSYPNPAS